MSETARNSTRIRDIPESRAIERLATPSVSIKPQPQL